MKILYLSKKDFIIVVKYMMVYGLKESRGCWSYIWLRGNNGCVEVEKRKCIYFQKFTVQN